MFKLALMIAFRETDVFSISERFAGNFARAGRRQDEFPRFILLLTNWKTSKTMRKAYNRSENVRRINIRVENFLSILIVRLK